MIRPRWAFLMGAFACSAVRSVTTVSYAYLAGPLLAALYSTAGAESAPAPLLDLAGEHRVARLAAILLAITVARAVASYGEGVLTAKVGEDVVRRLRQRMYEHLLRASPEVLVSRRAGEIAARLSNDAQHVRQLVSTNAPAALGQLATIGGLGALAFSLDSRLAAVALLGMPPIAAVVAVVARRARRAQGRVLASYAHLAGQSAELAQTAPVIRAYAAESTAGASFRRAASELEDGSLVAQRWAATTAPLAQTMGGLALVAALLYSSGRLAEGEITVETFVSFFTAMFFFYRPVASLGNLVSLVASGLAALDRVAEVFRLPVEPDEPDDAEDLPPMRRGLTLRGVRFAYGKGPEVLDDLDLEVRAGESVAIVGSSGQGKSTLLMVMLGLLRPSAGEVRIDDRDAASATRASWRRQFGWVTQEPLLFADTLVANVALADAAPDRERVREALERAGVALDGLPDGIDTVLLEGGRGLSGGERQRLCIARALYRDPPVLVFDEATSSLDGPSERAIAETIEGLMGERTVILVSHRLSTVQRADRVVVLDGGRVVETGSPARLWETGGRFHELFRDARIH